MGDIQFNEQLFNKQMNDCRENFFNSLSLLLKNYNTHRINGTQDSQLELEKAWTKLNASFNEIKTLKQAFILSIDRLIVVTKSLDDSITTQNAIKTDLKLRLAGFSGSKETSMGMLDNTKILRTHVLYGNYLLTVICIFMIVKLVKIYRENQPKT